MTEAKYTPGPWTEWRFDTQADIAVGPVEGGLAIAEIVTVNANGIRTQESFDTGKANARLIAAAPEMLEFIESISMQCSECCPFNDKKQCAGCPSMEAQKIIAKVKGEK